MTQALTDEKIPPDLALVLEQADIGNKFIAIIKKYPLHIDQEAGAWSALELLIRGRVKPDNFVRKIEQLGYMEHPMALRVGQDINNEILIPIRDTLQKLQELAETRGAEVEGKESILRGITNPETIYRPTPAPTEPIRTPVPVVRERDLPIPEPENMPAPAVVMERLSIQPTITANAPIAPAPVKETPSVVQQPAPSLTEEKLGGITRMPASVNTVAGDQKRVIPEDLKARINSDPYKEQI